jgi:hypothetical protein
MVLLVVLMIYGVQLRAHQNMPEIGMIYGALNKSVALRQKHEEKAVRACIVNANFLFELCAEMDRRKKLKGGRCQQLVRTTKNSCNSMR